MKRGIFTPQLPHSLPHNLPHDLLRGNQKYTKIHDFRLFMHKIVYNGWGEVRLTKGQSVVGDEQRGKKIDIIDFASSREHP